MEKNELSFAQLKELGFSVVIKTQYNVKNPENFSNGV